MGKFPFFITAPRIEGSACSQYPKYQSVSIITISSRRDPTVSPLLSSFWRNTSKAFRHCSFFITQFFLRHQTKRSRNQTKDVSTKAGQAVKRRAADPPVDAPRTLRLWGGRGLQNAQRSMDGMQENHVFHFYVTTVINPLGVGGLLKGMTQLRLSPSCEG